MNKWNSVYGRMGMVFLSASVVALLVFIADNHKAPQKNEKGKSVLARGGYGDGERNVDLEVDIDGNETPLTVQIGEQQYEEEQLSGVFEKAQDRLEKLVLGNNESLECVRQNLNLVDEIPGTGIQVSWELSDYKTINLLGELQQEHLNEEGTLVELRAFLSYGEEEAVHSFYVHVFPPKRSKNEKVVQQLKTQIQKQNEDTAQNEYLVLPDEIEGKTVSWKYPGERRAGGLFLLGIVGTGAVYANEKQRKKQLAQERKKELTADYPQLISQLTLFLGAGMTVRNAWFKMAKEYEKKKVKKGSRAAYEEMCYTMHEIQSGVPEGECYERFGSRCALPAYRKFGVILSQNLRKGTKGVVELLKRESADAFEDRMKLARRVGEEVGTKLLMPMFMMLAVVLVIIVVPAFFSIQI